MTTLLARAILLPWGRTLSTWSRALDLRDLTVIGQDWGSPAAEIVAIERPDRVQRLVNLNWYGVYSMAELHKSKGFDYPQLRTLWYVWMLNTPMGEMALKYDRMGWRGLCGASGPRRGTLPARDAAIEGVAHSFDGDDWIRVALSAYRTNITKGETDPAHDSLRERLKEPSTMKCPTRNCPRCRRRRGKVSADRRSARHLFSRRGERQAPAWHRPFPSPRIARSRRTRCNVRLTEAGSHGRKRRLLRASFNMPRTPPNSIHPKTRAEWREWLEHHQTQTEGVWLISFKKASGNPRLSYDEAVEEALCFGWVDSSKLNRLDAERSMLCFAPRKAGTGWSRLNKTRVEKLIIAGRMRPTGLAKVEAARQDGSWYALDSIEAIEIPPDLDKALTANRTAHQYFNAFPRSVKRAILEWITSAKKAETRAKRIEETVNSAAKNIRANQWRQHKVNRA